MVIRISRHGLTRCRACDQHFRVGPDVRASECPFCGASLSRAEGATPRALGRTGSALAAGLMSLGLSTGCIEPRAEPTDTTSDASPDTHDDTMPQPVYGMPMDIVEDADDAMPQPEYGMPMDIVEDTGPSPDIQPEPLYGMPFPGDVVEDADDPPPQPEYGMPPHD